MWDVLGPIAGVAIGALLTLWIGRSQFKRSVHDRWSERASEALADLAILLTNGRPGNVLLSVDREDRDHAWSEVDGVGLQAVTVRRSVSVVAAGHPDREVRDLARQLDTAVYGWLHSLTWAISTFVEEGDGFRDDLEEASKHHAEAEGLAQQIIERLHE